MRALRRTACAVVLALAVTAGCSSAPSDAPDASPDTSPSASPSLVPSVEAEPPRAVEDPSAKVPPTRPNIVMVLVDDMSMELLQTMPQVQRMIRRGASYPSSYVVDSLCCVSRTSLLTGQYPHQTGVRTNTSNLPNPEGAVGGFTAFREYGNEQRAVNVRLQKAGYATGYVGKFLNEYEPKLFASGAPPAPPGWTSWNVLFGNAYDGWDFDSSEVVDGQLRLRHHPAPPSWATGREKDAGYAGTVTEQLALDFIREHQPRKDPYFLVVAPYAPHSRTDPRGHYPGDPWFPAAFRDRPGPGKGLGNCGAVPCGELGVDDLPGYGDDVSDNVPVYADGSPAREWRSPMGGLPAKAAASDLRNRARMLQSVDRMVARIRATVDDDTVVVFSSDNGYHLGQHGLGSGKGSPYDVDVRVPLVVVGPGIAPGERPELTSNIDLAATFEELAGLEPAAYRAGRSLVPSLRRERHRVRKAVVIEHTWGPTLSSDPDRPLGRQPLEHIPSYVAARSETGLLVRVDLDNDPVATDHAWEFYDLTTARYERTNVHADPAYADEIAALKREIARFDRCSRHVRDAAVPDRCR